jgi:class 3 adenylate cyclase
MPSPDETPLERAIAQLEGHRAALGDAAIDAAVAALRRHAVAEPSTAAAPQRLRQVSILFADVADSTAMLGRVAPDEAMEVLGRALQGFADAVQQWGGQVLRYTGDGLKAAFGMRGLREHEAEQAVRAGLQMLDEAARHAQQVRDELGVADFRVRVGIHTGAVLLGGGVEAERTAMGHAVHVAARMEQSAPAGRLRVSDATWALVRGLFVAEEQPPLTVKGVDEPLRTWLVQGVVTGPEPAALRGVDGVRTPLVGRDDELRVLRELHARCCAEGRPVLAVVLADAGVGKTRLRQELLQSLGLHEGAAGLLQARAHPSLALQPYGLLHQLLARRLAIHDDLDAAEARQRLLQGLAPWLGETAAQDGPRIGQLVGMDFGADPAVQALPASALRAQAYAALKRALHAMAARQPLLVVLDDLHWADAGSLDFARTLLDDGAVPLMLLALARPALIEQGHELRAAEGIDSVSLRLSPLGTEHGERLLHALLARLPEVPDALARPLLARSAGNPYYLEALVRMLVDDGVIDATADPWRLDASRLAALRVPETLVAVLQARLDALPSRELAALQRASVVGPVFWSEALAALDSAAPSALPALHRRELVRPRAGSAFAGTDEHQFAHALLHEVTYGTVLKADRLAGHAAAARWLAGRTGARADEFLALTAEHHERAGDSAQALDCWDRAHLVAYRRYANEDGLRTVERALAQPALTDPRWRYALMANRHELLDRMGRAEDARRVADAMAAWAETCDDDAMRADQLVLRMLVADHEGRPDEAERLARHAITLASRCDAAGAAALALAHGERAWLATMRRDWATVDASIADGLAAARAAARQPRRAMGYDGYQHQLRVVQMEALSQQDRHADVLAAVEQGLTEPGLQLRDRFNLVLQRARSAWLLGRVEEARDGAERALVLAAQAGMPRLRSGPQRLLALIAIDDGRLDDAQALLDDVDAMVTAHLPSDLPAVREIQGRLAHRRGDKAGAQARWTEAAEQYAAQGRTAESWGPRAMQAALDATTGMDQEARAAIDAMLAEAASQDARPHVRAMAPADLLECHRACEAIGDARATVLRKALLARLDEQLASLPDVADRQVLVTAVPHWRAVHAMR